MTTSTWPSGSATIPRSPSSPPTSTRGSRRTRASAPPSATATNDRLDDLWPDEDRRNGALDECAAYVLRPMELTDGEIVVLRLFSHGQTPEMVAQQLCLSNDAIKSRLFRARVKLKSKTKTEACCEALRQGLIV
jgi:DNA-binding NarL/FixJ family response regulator